MKTLVRILSVLMFALLSAGGAQAIPMTDLLNGGSITANDKLFDRWELMFQDKSDGTTVNTDNINVTALIDGGMDPGPGLRFDILNGEFNVTGDDIFAYLDFTFGFHVSVLNSSLKIKDNSLMDFSAFHSHAVDGSNDNGSYILEKIGTAPGLDDLGTKNVEFSVLDEVTTSILSDSAAFSPQSEIWVTKNILVWAVDSTDSAGVFGFTQRFSQVPEPGTPLLLAAAALAAFGVRRYGRRA